MRSLCLTVFFYVYGLIDGASRDNSCAPNPCLHDGTCAMLNNDGQSYECICPSGFNGDNCETNINECAAQPCENGGLCNDGSNAYTCDCMEGFGGHNCQIDVDDCASNPCLNGGTCFDDVNKYSCVCEPGFGGPTCSMVEPEIVE